MAGFGYFDILQLCTCLLSEAQACCHSRALGCYGDFNIIRDAQEKISNTPPDLNDITEFNSCLERCGLDDLPDIGCEFTWFNKHDLSTRVYSKLDRVLTNADWILTFTQTYASFPSPNVSDHCPALLQFSGDPHPKSSLNSQLLD
ncbi:uncharacterized protein LOC141639429 [Silene latifolia]|uniref:uncharacterized protein LOC141639429 n=1 Tax=Silene latifolia TaxID=37657 RepID=UPI003D789090